MHIYNVLEKYTYKYTFQELKHIYMCVLEK